MQLAPNPARLMMLVMKFAFLTSTLFFVCIAIKVPTQGQQSVSPAFEWAITILGMADDVIGLFGRRLFLWLAKRVPMNEEASSPLRLWLTGNVLSLAFMESCVLFGMVLHFVGARPQFVELLFSVGILSLLFWSPGTPPAADKGTPFQI